jgi:hypothetical protein
VAQRVDEYTAAPPEEQNDRRPHSSFESTKKLQRWVSWRLLTIAQVLELMVATLRGMCGPSLVRMEIATCPFLAVREKG